MMKRRYFRHIEQVVLVVLTALLLSFFVDFGASSITVQSIIDFVALLATLFAFGFSFVLVIAGLNVLVTQRAVDKLAERAEETIASLKSSDDNIKSATQLSSFACDVTIELTEVLLEGASPTNSVAKEADSSEAEDQRLLFVSRLFLLRQMLRAATVEDDNIKIRALREIVGASRYADRDEHEEWILQKSTYLLKTLVNSEDKLVSDNAVYLLKHANDKITNVIGV